MLPGPTMPSRCASGDQPGTSTSQSLALSLRHTCRMKALASPALQVRHPNALFARALASGSDLLVRVARFLHWGAQ